MEDEIMTAQEAAADAGNMLADRESALTDRERELAERERAVTERELRSEAGKLLREKGLPEELIGTIAFGDEKSMRASLEMSEKAFRAAVAAELEKRMGGVTPQKGAARDENEMSDAEYYARLWPRG